MHATGISDTQLNIMLLLSRSIKRVQGPLFYIYPLYGIWWLYQKLNDDITFFDPISYINAVNYYIENKK